MSEILTNLSSPAWWFTTIFAAFLVNIVTAILLTWLNKPETPKILASFAIKTMLFLTWLNVAACLVGLIFLLIFPPERVGYVDFAGGLNGFGLVGRIVFSLEISIMPALFLTDMWKRRKSIGLGFTIFLVTILFASMTAWTNERFFPDESLLGTYVFSAVGSWMYVRSFDALLRAGRWTFRWLASQF